MDVDSAKKLKYGSRVSCPADRGDPAFIGTVRSEGLADAPVNVTHVLGQRVEYIWVEVSRPGHHKAVWPSNRLGKL